jgi:hypothetical protein
VSGGGLEDAAAALSDGSAAAEAAREAVEAAALAPPAPVVPPAVVVARVARLRDRTARDVVLAAEVAEFLAVEWRLDGEDVLAELGERFCRLTSSEVVIGHRSWPGVKRIPL